MHENSQLEKVSLEIRRVQLYIRTAKIQFLSQIQHTVDRAPLPSSPLTELSKLSGKKKKRKKRKRKERREEVKSTVPLDVPFLVFKGTSGRNGGGGKRGRDGGKRRRRLEDGP